MTFVELRLLTFFRNRRAAPSSGSRCALLFFGLPKKFKDVVLPSVRRHVTGPNPSCDVYAHAYNVTSTTNRRNGEADAPIFPEEVRLLTDDVVFDTEEEFYARVAMRRYMPYFPHKYAWVFPTSLHSLVKQWYSIDRAWDLMEEEGARKYGRRRGRPVYDRVGLFRSDVLYNGDIDIFDGDAVIPAHSNGEIFANDRMFYGLYDYAKVWAKGRLGKVDEYMKSEFGKMHCLHSERFMYHLVRELPIEYRDICFNRVRATGAVEKDDCEWEPELDKNRYWAGCHELKNKQVKEILRPIIIKQPENATWAAKT
uniref:Uncharacterized protein n=2 Tax=Corethron hystrix TaxID=216773 RepID=A0A7S1BH99_9STRA